MSALEAEWQVTVDPPTEVRLLWNVTHIYKISNSFFNNDEAFRFTFLFHSVASFFSTSHLESILL